MIRESIIKLSQKQDLTYGEAEEVMDEIMSGKATPVQIVAEPGTADHRSNDQRYRDGSSGGHAHQGNAHGRHAAEGGAFVSAAVVVPEPPEPPHPASNDAAMVIAAITLTTFFIFFIRTFPPFLLLTLFTKRYLYHVLCVN